MWHEKRIAYRILIGKPHRNKALDDLKADGWIKDNGSYRNAIRGLGMDLLGSG